jgi:hypothetical protein
MIPNPFFKGWNINKNMDSKKWYASKTIWIALLQFIGGGLVVLSTNYPAIGVLGMLKSVIDILVRYNTASPIE